MEAADLAATAKEFRNLIHPARADKKPHTLGMEQSGVAAMIRVAEELENASKPGSSERRRRGASTCVCTWWALEDSNL